MARVTQTSMAVVLEQDFILQVRRLQRLTEPHYVFNIMFALVPKLQEAPDLLEAIEDKLQDFASKAGGSLYLTTNADAFLVMPAALSADPKTYIAAVVTAIMPEGFEPGVSIGDMTRIYNMPDDYMPLRERVNEYIEIAKKIEEENKDDPERNLRAANVHGPLTAYSLSQIERLLDDMDIQHYARGQSVMELQGDKWTPYYEENYVSIGDMQKDKFPRLELQSSFRLFMELGSVLDRRMLAYMLRIEGWQGSRIGLNLSAKTVLSSTFAQFCHIVTGANRNIVTFEVNISDLFNDLPQFQNALVLLRKEGFRVALDGLRPDTMPLLRLENLDVDDIKISVSKKNAENLTNPIVLQSVRQLKPSQIIFMHVENAGTIEIGKSLGVTKFQGFYIDEITQ